MSKLRQRLFANWLMLLVWEGDECRYPDTRWGHCLRGINGKRSKGLESES